MSIDVVASEPVLRRIGEMALERQRRREQAGDGNFGSPLAGAADHALGLLGEWACVRVWYPERVREWARLARADMADDCDVFGLLVRTRDSHGYEGWINARDAFKECLQFHALVTTDRVKNRLLLGELQAVNLRVWGRVWGGDCLRDDYFRRANGVFPNRDSYVIPHEAYELDGRPE